MDLDHLQAMEQVLPEGARSHARGKIGVAGGDQAKVAADQAATADSSKHALLQHAEELCLGLEGQVRDLVQEKGAAVRQLEDAHPPTVGAGEGTAFVAEELALEQGGRDGVAVHGDEIPGRSVAQLVDEPGDEFLAGAGLTRDQDRHVGRRYLLDLAEDWLQRGAAADQPALAVHLDVDGLPARAWHLTYWLG